jgi:hypothetical protein
MQRFRSRFVSLVALLALIAAALPGAALAVPPSAPTARADGAGIPLEFDIFHFPGSTANDLFGGTVAVSGKIAVTGSPYRANGAMVGAGRASAFEWIDDQGWMYDQVLDTGTYASIEYAGASVAVSGSTILVGIPGRWIADEKMMGVVLPMTKVGGFWLAGAPITAPRDEGGNMGGAMAADGQTLAVGSWNAVVGGVSCGSVLIYTKSGTGWTGPVVIDPPAPQANQNFGDSVALNGDDLIVGSPGYASGQGRAFAYRRSGSSWVYKGEFSMPSPAAGDVFGNTVAVSNGVCLVGAPARHQGTIGDSGAVRVYRYNGTSWAPLADLASPWVASNVNEQFGDSLSIVGDTAIVHARYGGVTATSYTGGVYQFLVTASGVSYVRAGVGSGSITSEDFGPEISYDGETLMVGGPNVDSATIGENIGAVWFFYVSEYRPRANSTFTVASPGVLTNDFSGYAAITASLVSAPAHGSAQVNADGSFSYTPTPGYVGPDSFVYKASNTLGNSVATVNLTVVAPTTKTPSAITIRTDKTSLRMGKTFQLTGVFSKGAYRDSVVVWVKKPGSKRWSYSSARLCFRGNADGTADWWYRYLPKRIRGKYAFKVSFQGDATRAAVYSPNIVYVTVK